MKYRGKPPLASAPKTSTPVSAKPGTAPRARAAQTDPASPFRQSEELPSTESPVAPPTVQRLQAAESPGENRTGMPDPLKAGLEQLSGLDMSDVRVRYNSSKPAELQALAYAQGNQIHLGPGQERHLPHEAWHVVQQKQGRVRPTVQAKPVAADVIQRTATYTQWQAGSALPDGTNAEKAQKIKAYWAAIAADRARTVDTYYAATFNISLQDFIVRVGWRLSEGMAKLIQEIDSFAADLTAAIAELDRPPELSQVASQKFIDDHVEGYGHQNNANQITRGRAVNISTVINLSNAANLEAFARELSENLARPSLFTTHGYPVTWVDKGRSKQKVGTANVRITREAGGNDFVAKFNHLSDEITWVGVEPAEVPWVNQGKARSAAPSLGPVSPGEVVPSAPVELPKDLQRSLEPVVQTGLSNVGVVPNSTLPGRMDAVASAAGDEIHFAPGMYRPQQEAGRELIGHELGHVAQQRQGRVAPDRVEGDLGVNADAGLEREADALGRRARLATTATSAASGLSLQRKEMRLNDDLGLEREAERMGDAALRAEPGAPSRNLEQKSAPAPVVQPYMEFLAPLAEYLGVDATVATIASALGISSGALISGLLALGTFATILTVNKLIAWLTGGAGPGAQPLPGNALQPAQQGGGGNAQQVQPGVGGVNAQPLPAQPGVGGPVNDQPQPAQQAGGGPVNAQPQPAQPVVDPVTALRQQWQQQDRAPAEQAFRNLWQIRYSNLATAQQQRILLTGLLQARLNAFQQDLADPANLLTAQTALMNLMPVVNQTLQLIAAGQAQQAAYYVRISHRVVEQIHQNPAAAVPGGNGYAQQRLTDYQNELGTIQAAFNAAVAAPNPAGIGTLTYKGVNFDVDTTNNNYISAAGQQAEQYPQRPLSPVNFRNLINAMINPDNSVWQGYNPRDLAIFLAAIFVEPSRYAPARVTNLIAAGREGDYTQAGQQSIFNVLPMTTGGTDPAANPTHPDLVGQAGTLPTQATGNREEQMIVEPNRGWIEDAHHLQNVNYTDAQLVTDLVDVQHTAILNFLNS